jgi:hypothetical protein
MRKTGFSFSSLYGQVNWGGERARLGDMGDREESEK